MESVDKYHAMVEKAEAARRLVIASGKLSPEAKGIHERMTKFDSQLTDFTNKPWYQRYATTDPTAKAHIYKASLVEEDAAQSEEAVRASNAKLRASNANLRQELDALSKKLGVPADEDDDE